MGRLPPEMGRLPLEVGEPPREAGCQPRQPDDREREPGGRFRELQAPDASCNEGPGLRPIHLNAGETPALPGGAGRKRGARAVLSGGRSHRVDLAVDLGR
jgi:hypothetical protein